MSFKHAIRGIRMVLKSERNMQIHLFFVFAVVVAGILCRISTTEWLVCMLAFGMVMGAEMLNTAIETLVDLVSPGHNELAGKSKDIAAGAVLISALFAAIAGLVIFVPKLAPVFQSVWSYIASAI